MNKKTILDCLKRTCIFSNVSKYHQRHRSAMFHTNYHAFHQEIHFILLILTNINTVREHAAFHNDSIDYYDCITDLLLLPLMRSINTFRGNIYTLNTIYRIGSSTNFWYGRRFLFKTVNHCKPLQIVVEDHLSVIVVRLVKCLSGLSTDYLVIHLFCFVILDVLSQFLDIWQVHHHFP
jgi:hypothetical protein